MEKVCFKCGKLLPLSSFYKHSGMADGHLNKCKDCTRNDTKINRKRQKELKESDPETFSTKQKSRCNNYRDNYPDKYKAHCCVNNAIKYGKLQKIDFCENCGSDYKVQAHHESYQEADWLNVIWLCDKCHKKRHRVINKYIRNCVSVAELTLQF